MPALLFGCAKIGNAFSTAENTSALFDTLKACRINYLDTVAVYPPSNPGVSERLIGTAKAAEKGYDKVRGDDPGHGSLKKTPVEETAAALNDHSSKGHCQKDTLGLIGNIESPLAGGFLTRNFSIGNGTRFAEDNPGSGIFKKIYDKQVMNLAIKDLHAFLQQRDISLAEASLRWLYHHSALETEDEVHSLRRVLCLRR